MKEFLSSLARSVRPTRPDPRRDDRTVIFLHIPKTAGTTVRDIVRINYRSEEIHDFPDIDAREATDSFCRLSEEERIRFRVVMGHMWFGIHESVPRPSTYVTLLRDPVHRIISHYHFVRNTPGHYLHRLVAERKMSLGDYAASGISTELDNGQTRLLAGARDEERWPVGACTEELLGKACTNLENRFAVVGLQERFDETLRLLEQTLKWKTRDTKRNVNVRRPPADEVPQKDLEAVEACSLFDRRLYDFAGRLFDKRLAEGGGP